MRIAVLGAGAMGLLLGCKLSACHEVCVLDRNAERVRHIAQEGVTLIEPDGDEVHCRFGAAVMGETMQPVDLVILMTKVMGSDEALFKCKSLLGEETLLLSLQNGGGHEEVLSRYAPQTRVLIGTTQHNASIRAAGCVFHGGSGETVVGSPYGQTEAAQRVAQAFADAGMIARASEDIRRDVWRKLLTNASLSALTGVLQSTMGLVTQSDAAWALCEALVREACDVARADGVDFDVDARLATVRLVSERGPDGVTSICADLSHGRRTEVESISGYVVRAARRLGMSAPRHEMMVGLIHAMEDKNALGGDTHV